jgi:ABC-type cobalamin/Fe3+-siderophores transport system ATPase subunit
MLTGKDLWFEYDADKPVLRGVSLDVPRASIVGILGPNGSGKTTLLRLLAGTRRPQRGAVTLDGVPLSGFSRAAVARRMAVVPQETQLAFDYTVAEVAMMGRYAHLGAFEIEGPSEVAIVDRALDATGTLALRDRPFATLSGGEKQRVIIGAALAQIATETFRLKAEATGVPKGRAEATGVPKGRAEATGVPKGRAEATGVPKGRREATGVPKGRGEATGVPKGRAEATGVPKGTAEATGVPKGRAEATGSFRENSGSFRLQPEDSGYLLLDEPTASLDLGYQLEVVDLLRKLHDERGISIVISTHDLSLAGTLCERVVMMREGQVVAAGPARDTLTPDHVRSVYDVDVDVLHHSSGRRVLVPTGRSPKIHP